MELLIFKTNIENAQKMRKLGMNFSRLPQIRSWTLDAEDIDKVLKVRIDQPLGQWEVQSIVTSLGFVCEALE